MFAEQGAVEPPYEPVQVQDHGPLPLTDDAVPALQRLVAGADVNVCPFDDPQAPFIGMFVDFRSEQDALVPPFEPLQFQRYCALESAISLNVPFEHEFNAVPQIPFTEAAELEAELPVLVELPAGRWPREP